MKILMLTRHNFETLGGGDKVQILKTKEGLEALGHTVVVSPRYVPDIRSYDVIHLFNIQINPHSFLVYLVQAQLASKPVALSTIFWNPDEWKNHQDSQGESSPGRLRSLFTYRFKGVPPFVLLRYLLASSAVRRWFSQLIMHPGGGAASAYTKKFVVENADVILPNGVAEADQVKKYLGVYKACVVIPNGVSTEFAADTPDQFVGRFHLEDFVLSVGRIETRKNLLALARATKKLGLPLVLIGNDRLEPDYVELVRQEAGNLTIIPEMDHALLGSAYKAARVHALVSWFETPGLSSLEAAAAGCNIVSTDIGTAKEYFGDLAWYCSPSDPASIEAALRSAWDAPRDDKLAKLVANKFNWQKVAKATESAYKKIAVGK